jgi:hypothetical protein
VVLRPAWAAQQHLVCLKKMGLGAGGGREHKTVPGNWPRPSTPFPGLLMVSSPPLPPFVVLGQAFHG